MKKGVFDSTDAISFNRRMSDLLAAVKKALANRSQTIGGERYLTTREVCGLLKINAGTLQQYRDDYRIGFISLCLSGFALLIARLGKGSEAPSALDLTS